MTIERTIESERVEKLGFHEESAGNLKGLVKIFSLSLGFERRKTRWLTVRTECKTLLLDLAVANETDERCVQITI